VAHGRPSRYLTFCGALAELNEELAALTELWEKARKAQFAQVQVLSIRLFDATDAFRMLGSVNAEKGCSKQVKLTGGYVTSEGGEMQLEFTGAPGDAMPVKDFLVPQLNAARERDVQATFVLTFNPGLRADGYSQTMVFTQYTDTMDFLRDELATKTSLRVMCFSGRGGEVRDKDGRWRAISREEGRGARQAAVIGDDNE
jgi:hypothetical protein